MSHSGSSGKRKPIRFLFENSIFLIAGAVAALIWANVDAASYQHFVHFDLTAIFRDVEQRPHDQDDHGPDHDHAEHVDTSSNQASGEPPDEDDRHRDQDGDHDVNHQESRGGDDHDLDHGGGPADPQESDAAEHAGGDHANHGISVHFFINDLLMALFFAIAGKEVWESMLPGGALSNPRRAATPLLATAGGILGPAGVYLIGAYLTGTWDSLNRGWAIPCATDIAFSYLVARIVFGVGHPAIAFLLLLAIADDAAGLIILAIAYPSKPIEPSWFLLTVAAIGVGFGMRWFRLRSFWWYLLIPGTACWFSFVYAGIHPALGLVPIIPCMPHAHTDLGFYLRDELNQDDTLNAFEHWWKNPVEIILGLFGLANAGVVFSAVGVGTGLVVLGLLVGKPLGITICTWFAERVLRLEVPVGMGYKHILSLGIVAAIGFTVALFVSTAAFRQPGPIQDSVKMGALLSFFAAPIAIMAARMLGVRPTVKGSALPPDAKAST